MFSKTTKQAIAIQSLLFQNILSIDLSNTLIFGNVYVFYI